MRLTVAQALVRFLADQYTRARRRRAARCSPAASASSATATSPASARRCSSERRDATCRYYQAPQRAGDGARRRRLRQHARTGCATLACTTSIGPGATNMVTGAALATINRLPVLLLPGDIFATRAASRRCCSSSRIPQSQDVSVNDCFRPVSRYWDRINRPEQLLDGAAGGDARADRPGRDRRGHAGAAAGRAGRGVRLPGGALRASASGACRAPAPEPRARWRRPPTLIRARAAPADRRRRRRDLHRGDRGAARAGRGDRHPGRRDAGRQGRAAATTTRWPRRDRRHRHDRAPTRSRARPTW